LRLLRARDAHKLCVCIVCVHARVPAIMQEKLAKWRATIEGCKRLGKDPLSTMELNFRFVGAPGACHS
jgi:hypothetical protein